MDAGKRPWQAKGNSIHEAREEYGPAIIHGNKAEWFDDVLFDYRSAYFYDKYQSYDLFLIRGPFPEPDVTVQLSAVYFSLFTLGLAEIIMFPPTLIDKTIDCFQDEPFLFLYNAEQSLISVEHIPEDIFIELMQHKELNQNANNRLERDAAKPSRAPHP